MIGIIGGLLAAGAVGLSVVEGRKRSVPGGADARLRMDMDQKLKLLQTQIQMIPAQEGILRGKPAQQIIAAKARLAEAAAKTAGMVGLPKTAEAMAAAAIEFRAGRSGSQIQDLLKQEKWPGTDETVLDYIMRTRPAMSR